MNQQNDELHEIVFGALCKAAGAVSEDELIALCFACGIPSKDVLVASKSTGAINEKYSR